MTIVNVEYINTMKKVNVDISKMVKDYLDGDATPLSKKRMIKNIEKGPERVLQQARGSLMKKNESLYAFALRYKMK